MIAVDTNLFVGAIQTYDSSLRATARRAFASLHRRGEALCCFPQNLIEFWNVATRPANSNGLGLSPEQADNYLDRFQRLAPALPETPDLFPAWRQIVFKHRVHGIHVHDARIVAAMTINGVNLLLTFDKNDFKRYQAITVLDPVNL